MNIKRLTRIIKCSRALSKNDHRVIMTPNDLDICFVHCHNKKNLVKNRRGAFLEYFRSRPLRVLISLFYSITYVLLISDSKPHVGLLLFCLADMSVIAN